MFKPGDTVKIDYIGKKDIPGNQNSCLVLGKEIGKGGSQVCFELQDDIGDKVVKILYGPRFEAANKLLLDYEIVNIPLFFFSVLDAIQKTKVKFPNCWNVFSGTIRSDRVTGFIQTNLGDALPAMTARCLPNIGQADYGFTKNLYPNRPISPHLRDTDLQEFCGSVFFDWDSYLFNIINGKQYEESLEKLYAKIASTDLSK